MEAPLPVDAAVDLDKRAVGYVREVAADASVDGLCLARRALGLEGTDRAVGGDAVADHVATLIGSAVAVNGIAGSPVAADVGVLTAVCTADGLEHGDLVARRAWRGRGGAGERSDADQDNQDLESSQILHRILLWVVSVRSRLGTKRADFSVLQGELSGSCLGWGRHLCDGRHSMAGSPGRPEEGSGGARGAVRGDHAPGERAQS